MNKLNIESFLKKKNYDIRLSNNARWIDQKCTPDVIQVIAEAIIDYTANDIDTFTIKDIWNSKFSKEEIVEIFKKPDTNNPMSKSEYDKFFSQPIKFFSYAGLLVEDNSNRTIRFKIKEKEILNNIALSERFTLEFLVSYIEKVLSDSDVYYIFENFFIKQDKTSFNEMKTKFVELLIFNTPINTSTEASRIFTKVINPLSYKKNLKGTNKGRLSKDIITKDVLMYNRNNFRDIYVQKPKGTTRSEFISIPKLNYAHFKFQSNQAKKRIRKFNLEKENGLSQYSKDPTKKATQMHHIFSASEFPTISGYVENLIALTPNEHFLYAHKDNNVHYTNAESQKEFLMIKAHDINHYSVIKEEESIYSFKNFGEVLSVGFNKEEIKDINEDYYNKFMHEINIFYNI